MGILQLRRRVRGFAAVELALLLPTFLFVMVATAEAGRALYQYNGLTKAVRDGAQYLARNGVDAGTGVLAPTGAHETVARALVVYGSPTGTVALLPGMTTGQVGIAYEAVPAGGPTNYVTVTATYTFQPLGSGLLATFGLQLPSTFAASMRMRAL